MYINSKSLRSRFSNFHQVRGLGFFFFFFFVCPGRDTISPRFQGRPRFRALISARAGYQTKRDGLNFNTVDIHANLSSRCTAFVPPWHRFQSSSSHSRSPRKRPPVTLELMQLRTHEVNEETPRTTFPLRRRVIHSQVDAFPPGESESWKRGRFPGQKAIGEAAISGQTSAIPAFFLPRREIVASVFRALYRFRSLGSQLSSNFHCSFVIR